MVKNSQLRHAGLGPHDFNELCEAEILELLSEFILRECFLDHSIVNLLKGACLHHGLKCAQDLSVDWQAIKIAGL